MGWMVGRAKEREKLKVFPAKDGETGLNSQDLERAKSILDACMKRLGEIGSKTRPSKIRLRHRTYRGLLGETVRRYVTSAESQFDSGPWKTSTAYGDSQVGRKVRARSTFYSACSIMDNPKFGQPLYL
jgi:hypothetical protein